MKLMVLVLFLFLSLIGQQINVNVKVTAQRLTAFEKDEIKYLKEAIQSYINDFEWSESENDDIIQCDFSFIIESVTDQGGENVYQAQFLASSPAQENFYDKNMSFKYSSTEELRHYSADYQPLTNFIDFYTSMILAGELDTYKEFGGEEQYGRAREALIKGKNSAYAGQWNYREKIYLDGTTPFVRTLRLAKLNYFSGLAEQENGNIKESREFAHLVIENIQDAHVNQPNNTMLKRFFEGYHKWIVELLDPNLDRSILENLGRMDPVRKSFYLNYMEN